CAPDGGSRLGLGDVAACLPERCVHGQAIDCGSTESECGLCPQTDGPTFGQGCGSSCGPNQFCSYDDSCVASVTEPDVLVPDGAGSSTPLPPLPPATATAAGAVPGSFSVSDDGAAQYTIPLELPPGRAGMQPALSLLYTGTKTNGHLGLGWSVQGLSSISRCPRTYALDGKAAPITGTDADALCIDGKRLVPVSEPNAPAGETHYRTAID